MFTRGARCDTHYIISPQDNHCPVSTCLTVSELFSDTSYFTGVDNLTLIFQPGNHTLDTQVVIGNISLLELLSNETSTTRIVCKNSVGFKFVQVGTIDIRGLSFHGCGESYVTLANKFTLWNSTFEGSESIGTAFVLNETTTALIKQCSFLSYSQGNIRPLAEFTIPEGSIVPNIISNVTRAHVGGAMVCTHSNVRIEFSTFQENEANYGGVIFAESSCILLIVNSKFYLNKGIGLLSFGGSEGGGGGVLFALNSQIEIENCTFFNNSLVANPGFHSKGGVILGLKSEISVVDSMFLDNKITGNGGGGVFYLSHSSLCSLQRNNFSRNSAHFSGVMHLHSSNSSITQSNFDHNTAYDRSGVIGTTQQSYIKVKSSTFGRNRARTLAGVLSMTFSTATLEDILFLGNSVKKVGAVMCVFDQGYVKVNNVTVANNEADLSVIALYSSSAEFVNFNTFVDNQGSLLAHNSSIRFKGETIFQNCTTAGSKHFQDIALQEGGALSAYSSHVIFQGRTVFIHNAAIYGGALFAVESVVLLQSSNLFLNQSFPTFSPQYSNIIMNNNTAINNGGGIYLHHSTFNIKDGSCHVTGNTAFYKGGGIHAINSDVRLESSNNNVIGLLVLAENQAQMGGGVFMQDNSKLSLDIYISKISIRLIGNVADYGAAIFVDDNSTFETCSTTPTNITPASECFFRITNTYSTQSRANDALVKSIVFQNNYAKYGGNNLFGGLLDRCTLHTTPSSIYDTLLMGDIYTHEKNANGLSRLLNISNIESKDSIASYPVQVCFCSQDLVDCTLRANSVQVKKGEMFNLSIVAVDQVKTAIRAKVFSLLSSQDSDLTEGQGAWSSTSCTNISFSILSSNETESLEMFAAGPCKDAKPS